MPENGESEPGDLEEVFERISDAFYAVDEEFRFTFINEHAEELLQADREYLLGKCVFDEYPEAKETDAYRAFKEALETQEPTEYELYFEPLDFWVNARVYPSETGLSVYFRDVTERKEREETLRQQRERLAALNNVNALVRDINRALVEQSTREDIEELVCERLAASESYEFAWIGRLDDETKEIVPTTTANTQGYLEDVTVTADGGGYGSGPTGKAIETNAPQFVRDVQTDTTYEPWRDVAVERGISASAAIPITDGDLQYGVLNVYSSRPDAFDGEEAAVVSQLGEVVGLAIAALASEANLERERERLEFVNRLVRHNILNSLNVVEARAEILESYVREDGDRHLETVQSRTAEMTDLVEKLRSLTGVLVESADRDLERVPVGDVLEAEVARARETFTEATFDLTDAAANAGPVLADDLLEEVLENLLSNAVQHNDRETPRIVVDADPDPDAVVVRVADDGPGIPDELKRKVFGKGERGFESPGTGFGLYFVKEIVESYGGDVDVSDNDPRGAVFDVRLPRS